MGKCTKRFVFHEPDGNAVVLGCRLDTGEEAFVRVDVLAPDMVRGRASLERVFPQSFPEKDSFPKAEWPQQAFTVTERRGAVEMRTKEIAVKVSKEPSRLSFHCPDGSLFLKEDGEARITWREAE